MGRCALRPGGTAKLLRELKTRFGLAHRHDFERIAVVGGPSWLDWGVKLSALMMSGELRSFSPRALESAVAWVKEGKADE